VSVPTRAGHYRAVPAAVVAMRETAIIAAAGFLIFIRAAALLVYFLVS
jgi:hypothetical protein